MNRMTRMLLTSGLGLVAGVTIGAGPAMAAANTGQGAGKSSTADNTARPGDRVAGYFDSREECRIAGRLGDRFGRWDDWNCYPVRGGHHHGDWVLVVAYGDWNHGGWPHGGWPHGGWPHGGWPHGGPIGWPHGGPIGWPHGGPIGFPVPGGDGHMPPPPPPPPPVLQNPPPAMSTGTTSSVQGNNVGMPQRH
jgi:hypothetical protein